MIFPISYIIYLNILIIAVLLLFLWSGYQRGFLMKLLDCFSMVLLAIISWFLSGSLSKFFHLIPQASITISQPDIANSIYDTMNRIGVFILLFLVVWIALMLIKPLFKTISAIPIIKSFNRLLGVLFGALQAVIILIMITFVMQTPLFANGNYIIEHSHLKAIVKVENVILENVGSTAKDLKALQKIITPNSALDHQDEQRIKNWLKQQGIEEAKIQVFMKDIIGN